MDDLLRPLSPGIWSSSPSIEGLFKLLLLLTEGETKRLSIWLESRRENDSRRVVESRREDISVNTTKTDC